MAKSRNKKSTLGEPGEFRTNQDRIKPSWVTPRAGAWFQKTKSCLFETCDWTWEPSRLKLRLGKAIWFTFKANACLQGTESWLFGACAKDRGADWTGMKLEKDEARTLQGWRMISKDIIMSFWIVRPDLEEQLGEFKDREVKSQAPWRLAHDSKRHNYGFLNHATSIERLAICSTRKND